MVFVYFIGQSQQDKSDIKIHDFFFTKACRLNTEGSRMIIVKIKINEAKRMQCPQNLKFSQRFVLPKTKIVSSMPFEFKLKKPGLSIFH